ncbi:MAG: hypothetical protein Q9195_004385 [Heterodermia aff. obscurata]
MNNPTVPGADSAEEPSSPSPSASLDFDHDTDIDSVDANILEPHYDLPPPDQLLPQHPPRQYPPRYSSLAPDEQTDPDLKTPASPASESRANEKYEFDEFWNQFHQKRRRKPDLPVLSTYNNPEYGLDGIMDGRRGPHNARAYELPHDRQTLIPFIRNGWQANMNSGWSSPTNHNTPSWTQVLSAPRIRRWILVFFVSLSLSWLYWRRYGADAWTEHQTLSGAVSGRLKSDLGFFGTNMLPEFVGITQVKTLDSYFVPGSRDSRRLIFIGDVHGCRDEFASLLSELSFSAASDHLVLTGDLISKGPLSPAAVDLAIASNASCVRGNHEDRVLLAYRDLQYHHRLSQNAVHTDQHVEGSEIPSPPNPGNPNAAKEAEPDAEVDQDIDDEAFTSGDHVNQQLARSLSLKQISYLASCPLILDIGPVRGMGEVRAVHAGLVPGVSLDRQDPISVMHMRTLDLKTHIPSRSGSGTPWNKIWNKYQSKLPKTKRSTIIYGHDSQRGLQLEKYSKGLDTGCVKGGQLTALVVSSGANPKPKVVSVDCKDYRPKRASTEELGSS